MKRSTLFLNALLVVTLALAALPMGTVMADAPTPEPPPPADVVPPVVSNVTVAPLPVPANTPVTLTAAADDSLTGASPILSAEYSLNGGAWTAMLAVDGLFDTATENVTAQITSGKSGANEVCVRATDAANNVSDPVCLTFAVEYVFKGFRPPIRMNVANKANAPRTIPVKWKLMTAAGKPVSSRSVFVAVKSYEVDCATLAGDPTTAKIEPAPGKSGLRYLGSGNWMYNWKTTKAYRTTCRMMFVEFTGGQQSPAVLFQFK